MADGAELHALDKWAHEASAKVTEEREIALAAWLLETCGNMQLVEGLKERGWRVFVDEQFEPVEEKGNWSIRVRFTFKWIPPEDREED